MNSTLGFVTLNKLFSIFVICFLNFGCTKVIKFNCTNLIKKAYSLSDKYYEECILIEGKDDYCLAISDKIDFYSNTIYKTCNLEIATC